MRGRHAMVSYERPEQVEAAAEVCQTIALDNGAFSAWKKQRNCDFSGYRDWAQYWLKHPCVDWAVVPDVIDGDEAANDALLSEWDLPESLSVPVFHLHESLDRLEGLIASFPRIALGSSGAFAQPGTTDWWARISAVMSMVCDKEGMPRCKLHGLRMLDPTIYSHIPLASADSCNAALNLGIDRRWIGPYAPRSKGVRAIILIDRIESHASARRWSSGSAGVQQNIELLG